MTGLPEISLFKTVVYKADICLKADRFFRTTGVRFRQVLLYTGFMNNIFGVLRA